MDTERIQALIFDMDGVIVNSEPIHEKAEMEVFREFGMEVDRREWDGFRGKKADDIFTYVIQKYGNGDEPIEKMIERKIEMYLLHALHEMQLVSGAKEFFRRLSGSQKYRCALTTSGRKDQQYKILAKFGLLDCFQVMVTADDVKNGKPHPEPYIATVQRLNLEPDVCLVIEDSDNGILSAKAAGCQACGITTTFTKGRLEGAGADVIVAGFDELAQILFSD